MSCFAAMPFAGFFLTCLAYPTPRACDTTTSLD